MFARDSRSLLRINQGRLPLNNFESAYASHFGVSLVPASYGFPSLVALLTAVPHVVTIRGKSYRRTVLLCQDFLGEQKTCYFHDSIDLLTHLFSNNLVVWHMPISLKTNSQTIVKQVVSVVKIPILLKILKILLIIIEICSVIRP